MLPRRETGAPVWAEPQRNIHGGIHLWWNPRLQGPHQPKPFYSRVLHGSEQSCPQDKQGHWGHRGHLKGNHSQREGRCFLFQQDKGLAFCFLHPNTQRLQELPESVRRAEVTVNLRDKTKQNVKAKKKKKKKSKRKRSGGAKKWPHTFGTRKRHSSTTPPSRGCSLAFSRSRGDSKGTGKAALPAQTRQGNKIFGIRRDFQITKIENSSEVALILGFSLEMSLHP